MGRAVVGREIELTAIDRFLDAIPSGSASLIIGGTAGIGKTTLLQAAVRRAEDRGMRILSSRPGPSEARLTYAGLLDLLTPVDLALFGELPPPQRSALDAALLRSHSDRAAADQRSVATGFLSILRVLARSTALLIAIDDIQWLDIPTWRVLEFAVRRLEAEPVGLTGTVRVDDGPPRVDVSALSRDRREVRLGPLNVAALHEILRGELGHAFTRPTLVRIERASGGNPFFALELARAILDTGAPAPASGALAVPEDLAELLTRRLRRLPAASQEALLVASALSQPTIELLDAAAVARAEEAGVVRTDERGRVTFAHPLLAAAVYNSTSVRRRRQIHRELAARVTNAEERARHLALSTDTPDEQVARALVEAARSARERGAPDAAIELVGLACDRTPKSDREALLSRRLELGRNLSTAGDPQRAKTVLEELVRDAPPGPLRARAIVLLSFIVDWAEGYEASTSLCESALVDAGADDDLRAEIHATASRMADHDPERKAYHARAALDLVSRGTSDVWLRASALLAFAEAEFHAGRGIAHGVFEEAAALESRAMIEAVRTESLTRSVHLYADVKPSSRLLAILWLGADEFDAARVEFERDRRAALEHGDEAHLARTLGRLATLELRVGNWAVAERHLRDLVGIVERAELGLSRHRGLLIKAELDALRGRLEAARGAAEEALAAATAAGWVRELIESRAVLGLVELTAGDIAAARRHLDAADDEFRALGPREPGLLHVRHQANHIESLIAMGELTPAEAALERFEAVGGRLGRASLLATAGRCRALLLAVRGDLDGALAAVDAACGEHARVDMPFELARTLLAKGQIHRRRKEKALARDALARAVEIFDRLGSPPWSARARTELERTGLARRGPEALTSTEEEVAALAATGLTNRAIAERAFLSPKTVEANLARIYQKLGIHSRAELGRAMAQRERATAHK